MTVYGLKDKQQGWEQSLLKKSLIYNLSYYTATYDYKIKQAVKSRNEFLQLVFSPYRFFSKRRIA